MAVLVYKGKTETEDAKKNAPVNTILMIQKDQKQEQHDQILKDQCSSGVLMEEKYPDMGPHKGGFREKVEELED